MTLEADILDRVQADFSGTEGQKALDELLTSGKAGRIARCIVFAAQGSLESLREHIRMAHADYCNVITAGEHDISMRQVRDLHVSFLNASPDDFWIGETAASIHERGHYLTELKSQNATVGPFDYTCDRSECRRLWRSSSRVGPANLSSHPTHRDGIGPRGRFQQPPIGRSST